MFNLNFSQNELKIERFQQRTNGAYNWVKNGMDIEMGWFRDIDEKKKKSNGFFFDCVSLYNIIQHEKKLNLTSTTHTLGMLNWIKKKHTKNKLFLKRQFKSRLLIFICKSTKYHNIFHISKVYTPKTLFTPHATP